MRTFTGTADLTAARGEELGVTGWTVVTQDRVNLMADAIDDHQWIHVDEDRAADGPYGGTIAHGYLTLSLMPTLADELYDVSAWKTRLNYGLNRVRFPSPVRVGDRVRVRATLSDVTEQRAGTLLTVAMTMEIECQDRPACLSEALILLVGEPDMSSGAGD